MHSSHQMPGVSQFELLGPMVSSFNDYRDRGVEFEKHKKERLEKMEKLKHEMNRTTMKEIIRYL